MSLPKWPNFVEQSLLRIMLMLSSMWKQFLKCNFGKKLQKCKNSVSEPPIQKAFRCIKVSLTFFKGSSVFFVSNVKILSNNRTIKIFLLTSLENTEKYKYCWSLKICNGNTSHVHFILHNYFASHYVKKSNFVQKVDFAKTFFNLQNSTHPNL